MSALLSEVKRMDEVSVTDKLIKKQSENKDSSHEGDDSSYQLYQENSLETFYNYFFKEVYGDPIPFGKVEKLHLVIETLGSSSGIYSWPPAWEYGKNKANWLKYSLVITNPISNVLFLMKATDDMLTMITTELNIPDQLLGTLTPLSKKTLIAKYVKLLLGSIVCSVPFAITTYLFPLPNCDKHACLGTTIAHSLISNMILHAISWSFILTPEFWYYRIPFLPLEKLYNYVKNYCITDAEKLNIKATQTQKEIFRKYKKILTKFFIDSIENIIQNHLDKVGNAAQSIQQTDTLELIEKSDASIITFADLSANIKSSLPRPNSW